ncbi:MAG: ABC transporter substrate-binding protein [Actinomycetota bacterium]|nr:ABC transporter substrate-binding protein [Actinomycetota bacterium]
MYRKRLSAILLVIALTALAACSGDDPDEAGADDATDGAADTTEAGADEGEPRQGGTLVLQANSEISSGMHPFESNDPGLMRIASGTVYSKLVEFATGDDVDGLEVVGDLAEDWEISEDGLTYTFALRDDVVWHDIPPVSGRPFVADDVVATFMGLKEQEGLHAWMFASVDTVEAVDEHTVTFNLNEPFAPLLEYLAYHFNMIVPREGVDGEFDLATEAIGTGPFMVAEHTPDTEWVLERNPDYFVDGLPYVDELRMPIVTDTAAMTAAMRSGRLDIGLTTDSSVVDELTASDELSAVSAQGAVVSFYMNPTVEPFDDLDVRRAVMMAIDWDGMGESIRGDYNLTSLIRQDIGDAALPQDEVRELRPYDPEAARELLAGAGLEDGFSTTLTVQRVDEEDVREAQWIAQDLAEVGIDAEIEVIDPGTGIDRRRNHQFEITKALRGTHLPDQVFRDFDPESLENYTQVDDEMVNSMVAEARATTDDAERNEIYRELQRYFETELVTAIHPLQKYDYFVFNTRVHNVQMSPIYQGRRWAEVWVDE